jgi:PAS domain S-box-containing protein
MKNTFGISIIPENDDVRIEVLKRYKILDTPPEDAFDHIAQLTAQIFNVPISLVSLVDAEQVYFKANVGMGNVRSSSRGVSLCSLAVLNHEVTVFENAPAEPCLLSNPLVAGDFGLKFYAGAPITTPDGYLIGTLCVVDKEPRSFSDRDREILKGLARLVMDDIELRLAAIVENEKQQHIQIALAESEFRARLVVNEAPIAIGVLNGKTHIVEAANTKILEAWGKTTAIIGKPLALAIPELKDQPFLAILDTVFTTGEAFYGNEEKAVLMRNGQAEDVYFNFVYHPLHYSTGETHSILVIAIDVTAQIQARRQIESSKQQMEDMVMNSTMGMNIFRGRDLIIEMANQPMYEIWSRTPAEALGKPLMQVFPELVGQPFPDMLKNIFDTAQAVEVSEIPVTIMMGDSTKNLYINAKYVPLFGTDGQVESLVATIIDITESVTSRKFLEESEEELQSMNEELTATIEEMAVINEELTATNEELYVTKSDLEESIARLAESKIDLLKSEAMLRLSTTAAEIHTWEVDLATNEFLSSANLKDLFGYQSDEIMTLDRMNSQIIAAHKQRVIDEFQEALNETQKFDVEYMIVKANDNKSRWLRAKGKILYNHHNQPTHFAGVLLDITDKKEDEIRKNDFIAMVSHELKTPLTSLKGYIQLLALKNKKNEDPFITNALANGEKQLQKMLSIIDGFLNVSEMDAGKIVLNKTVFYLDALVNEITTDLQQITSTHTLIIKACPPAVISADRNKVAQVINNFLSNAIKYSPAGTNIEIYYTLSPDTMQLSVKDHGQGIKQQDCKKLFERFYRVDNAETKTIAGFGIGLYICSEIIKRHSGKIWVESEIGEGSTFCFSLPLSL